MVEEVSLLKLENEELKKAVEELEDGRRELERKIEQYIKKENENKRLMRNKINFLNEES